MRVPNRNGIVESWPQCLHTYALDKSSQIAHLETGMLFRLSHFHLVSLIWRCGTQTYLELLRVVRALRVGLLDMDTGKRLRLDKAILLKTHQIITRIIVDSWVLLLFLAAALGLLAS